MELPFEKIVVIGASSGIGKALAFHYLFEGADLITGGRSKSIAGLDSTHFKIDISTGFGLQDLSLALKGKRCLVIVTSATVGSISTFVETNIDSWLHTFETNVFGAVRVINSFSKSLHPDSLIVFFSGGGVGGTTHQSEAAQYVVSKTALVSLIEEYSLTSMPDSPIVVAVAPGKFNTGFIQRSWESLANKDAHNFIDSSEHDLDITRIVSLLELITSKEKWVVNGRLFSANWDSESLFSKIEDGKISQSNSIGKLRRIDDELFRGIDS